MGGSKDIKDIWLLQRFEFPKDERQKINEIPVSAAIIDRVNTVL